jgi:hypothetical protein
VRHKNQKIAVPSTKIFYGGQNFFDILVSSSYTSPVKKQCLIPERNVDGKLGYGTRNDKYTTILVADSL